MPSSSKRCGRFPNHHAVLVDKISKPNFIQSVCFYSKSLLFLCYSPWQRKTAKMAVPANNLYPVVHDLSETEYSTISNISRRTTRSDGGDYRNRAESTLTTAHNFLANSLWCGNNDTTLSSSSQRMASLQALGHHRRQEHLSVPHSQSTSPYHPYYSPQQPQRSPSPRTVTKQVVFAGAKPNGHFRQLEDDYVLTQQVCRD